VFSEFADGRDCGPSTFPHITYEDSMLKYGNDKPDLRNPLVIADVSDVFARDDVEFKAFKNKTVRAIPAPGAASKPRSWFDKMDGWAKTEMGATGLGYVVVGDVHAQGSVLTGPIAKFLSEVARQELLTKTGAKIGDAIFFSADAKKDRAANLAGYARTRIGRDLGLINENDFRFCWIVDFPMYEWNEDEKRIDFSHNPFSMPQYDREKFLALDKADKDTILGLKAYQYDIVCNGIELSSGAIRNHDPEVMLKAFEIAGYAREETEARFGGMLNAFRYGAPPHGGLAVGLERVVMLLAGEENIREVTMFPLTQQGQDLLMRAPSPASQKQLKELHLKVVYPEKS
jgi:aspartyl-tRNA synthetase